MQPRVWPWQPAQSPALTTVPTTDTQDAVRLSVAATPQVGQPLHWLLWHEYIAGGKKETTRIQARAVPRLKETWHGMIMATGRPRECLAIRKHERPALGVHAGRHVAAPRLRENRAPQPKGMVQARLWDWQLPQKASGTAWPRDVTQVATAVSEAAPQLGQPLHWPVVHE